jgi:hypothetical protein
MPVARKVIAKKHSLKAKDVFNSYELGVNYLRLAIISGLGLLCLTGNLK